MQKSCAQCAQQFEITAEDLDFYQKISPVFNGKAYLIPPPSLCPDCRQQHRLVWRNEQNLYRRKCDYSGDEILSLYSADKPHKVYKEEIWASDKWDPLDYGREYQFDKPFFDQFRELQLLVPRRAMQQDGTNENCEYVTFGQNNKNCYLDFACFNSEDLYYSGYSGFLKDSLDCLYCVGGELLYECMDCKKCYDCLFCKDCSECSGSYLLEDCRNCSNCIACKGLRNKEYHIYNKPVSKEEFEKYKKELSGEKFYKEMDKFNKWRLQFPNNYIHARQSENSDGDYLENAKNCHYCFDILMGLEDSNFCYGCGGNGKNLFDCMNAGLNSELLYESNAIVSSHRIAFTFFIRNGSDLYYCDNMIACEYCFGCIGLTHKKYCILNKQYTKEEYEKLVPKIIEHMQKTRAHGASAEACGSATAGAYNQEWGEFFPLSLSPFAYNETIANDYFPLNKEKTISLGSRWKEEKSNTQNKPDYSEMNRDIHVCKTCGKSYKTIARELTFYQKRNLLVPENCFNCRYHARFAKHNPRHLWSRTCAKCKTPIKTTYAPNRPEIVYCESCYLKEVY